jgi:hypothetical protein
MGLQLINQCLENSQSEGNSLSGGLSLHVYLRLQLCHVFKKPLTRQGAHALPMALHAAQAAVATAERRRGAFHVSLLCGAWIRAKCLLASAYFNVGASLEAKQNASEVSTMLIKRCNELPPSECGVMYGRAGALPEVWFLRQELNKPRSAKNLPWTRLELFLEGLKVAQFDPSDVLLLWEWKGKKSLGPQHGVVGIPHALLGYTEQEWELLGRQLPRVKKWYSTQLIAERDCIYHKDTSVHKILTKRIQVRLLGIAYS